MLFIEKHVPLIRQGEKTETRRDWDDDYHGPNPGSIIPATSEMFVPIVECACFIEIETRHPERLGDITEEGANREGYESVADFREAWRDINGEWEPDMEVTVLRFTYHGHTKASE